MSMQIRVDGWDDGNEVDVHFTCDGDGVSPAVAWSGYPDETESFVLWLIDPDAPRGTFTHWLLFNLPPQINALPEWVENLPEGAREGTNNFGELGYGAPCPPPGERHRYRFEVFALDTKLRLSAGVALRHVVEAMQGHVLDHAAVEGTYARRIRKAASRRLEQRPEA